MQIDPTPIKILDIKDLLDIKYQYQIPIYQRNYAWQAKEIDQLLQDVIDYGKDHPDKNYYIGTLVVSVDSHNGHQQFSTIDGQQRLTTLSIISSVIKNIHPAVDMEWFKGINIRYESRKRSSETMQDAFNGFFNHDSVEASIKSAYEICENSLQIKCKEHSMTIADFADYFYRFVKILKVPLPAGTDLNHYFEIMNSRGEQLEKHEILKAQLMKVFNQLNDAERMKFEASFDLVWDACASMERYVQYGFSLDQRHLLFGDKNWNVLTVNSFDELVGIISNTLGTQVNEQGLTLDQIIAGTSFEKQDKEKEESPDRFTSVINFQNFLLHVLRIQVATDEVALDDKRLLPLFEQQMKVCDDKIGFVKTFIYNLLRCRFLLDKYVIKREFTANTDRWSLKSLKWYSTGKVKNGVKYVNTFGEEQNETFEGDNRRILMLLSMFHVSIPSMVYKHWLNAALNYLFGQVEVDSKHYISYLEHIAKSFVFDRYLSNQPKEYFEMVYQKLSAIKRHPEDLNEERLKYRIENNLVFNFLDYLLWMKHKDEEKDPRVKAFEYTFRSSVEHYYPQHPIDNAVPSIDAQYLHSFGNLCLISHEKNSRLSNHSAEAKKDYYKSSPTLDSIKQFLMMKATNWEVTEIEKHHTEMVDVLKKNMSSKYTILTEPSLAAQWFKDYRVKNPLLLVRALLCFGDCTRYVSGDKYTFLDFDFMRQHAAFGKFEEYVAERCPKDLFTIVEKHLSYEKFKKEFQYLLVKYPSALEYCQQGNFQFFDKTEGNLVYLLEEDRNTLYKAKELYTYILQDYLLREHKIIQHSDNECLYIKIGYDEGKYFITNDHKETALELCLWNEDGYSLMHCLKSHVNGNSSAVRQLGLYNWQRNDEAQFERRGKSKLVSLGDNFEENISTFITEVHKLLRKGLGIKLL